MGGLPENVIDPWSLSKWGGGAAEPVLKIRWAGGEALKILFLCPVGLSLAFK